MKAPDGFAAAVDYIQAVLPKNSRFMLTAITPVEGFTEQLFTINHNIPEDYIEWVCFNITGHLYNETLKSKE